MEDESLKWFTKALQERARTVKISKGIAKRIRADGGCLGFWRRRRTWKAAKSPGEPQTGIDPGMSEWGNPAT